MVIFWSLGDKMADGEQKGATKDNLSSGGGRGLGINDGIIWQACRGEFNLKPFLSLVYRTQDDDDYHHGHHHAGLLIDHELTSAQKIGK